MEEVCFPIPAAANQSDAGLSLTRRRKRPRLQSCEHSGPSNTRLQEFASKHRSALHSKVSGFGSISNEPRLYSTARRCKRSGGTLAQLSELNSTAAAVVV